VVIEVLASHTTKVLHVNDTCWGCCSDSLIVKFDEALHEVMDGRNSTLPFELHGTDGSDGVICDSFISSAIFYSNFTLLQDINFLLMVVIPH
jgi:hypothetical protein